LSSFGVYLGRILRFNSWDIINHPVELFQSLLDSITNPEAHLFTCILGTFIVIVYTIFFSFINKKQISAW
jgi:uncharacterized membrane protein